MTDLRLCGVCIDGARYFCQRNSIDWTNFLTDGIDSDELISIGDHMAIDAVKKTEIRKRNGR